MAIMGMITVAKTSERERLGLSISSTIIMAKRKQNKTDDDSDNQEDSSDRVCHIIMFL